MPQIGVQLPHGADGVTYVKRPPHLEKYMAKKAKKRTAKRVSWSRAHHAELRKHSKAKTPVSKIAKLMKRSVGAVRQQGFKLGISLGHRR